MTAPAPLTAVTVGDAWARIMLRRNRPAPGPSHIDTSRHGVVAVFDSRADLLAWASWLGGIGWVSQPELLKACGVVRTDRGDVAVTLLCHAGGER